MSMAIHENSCEIINFNSEIVIFSGGNVINLAAQLVKTWYREVLTKWSWPTASVTHQLHSKKYSCHEFKVFECLILEIEKLWRNDHGWVQLLWPNYAYKRLLRKCSVMTFYSQMPCLRDREVVTKWSWPTTAVMTCTHKICHNFLRRLRYRA